MVEQVEPRTLDFRPVHARLPSSLGPPETKGTARGTTVAVWQGGAYAVGGGMCTVVEPGFGTSTTGVAGLSPAVGGAPLVRWTDGTIARLTRHGLLTAGVATAPRGVDVLVGLGHGGTFWASRGASSGAEGTTWLSVDGQLVWERPDPPAPVVPWGDIMVRLHPVSLAAVEGIVVADGAAAWTTELGAPVSLLAVVDGVVWVALPLSRIVGLDADSGTPIHEAATPAWVPTGPVDAFGTLHLVAAGVWAGLDLTGGGVVRFHRRLNIDPEGAACITDGGDLVAADVQGRVWLVPAHNPKEPALLVDAGETVKGIAIVHDGLIVLTGDRLIARWAS